MLIEFNVIGEMRSSPGHLLLLDEDGQCYDYDIALDEVHPIGPERGDWVIDIIEAGATLVAGPEEHLIAS